VAPSGSPCPAPTTPRPFPPQHPCPLRLPQDSCTAALRAIQAAEERGLDAAAAAKKAAAALTKLALDNGTRDNVTVLVVDLRKAKAQRGPGQAAGGGKGGSAAAQP
jgi:hypothetical protein